MVAQIILILPQNGKNGRNVGLRMELYGCKPGTVVDVLLLLLSFFLVVGGGVFYDLLST